MLFRILEKNVQVLLFHVAIGVVITSIVASSAKAEDQESNSPPTNRQEEGQKFLKIGSDHYFQGHYAEALVSLFQALSIFEELGVPEEKGIVLMRMGDVHAKTGRYAEALNFYQEALTVARAEHIEAGVVTILISIGAVHTDQGNYLKAIQCYRDALTTLDQMDIDEPSRNPKKATIMMSIAITYARFSYYDQVLYYAQQALDIFQKIQDQKNEINTLTTIGTAYEDLGQWQVSWYVKAIDAYQKALQIAETWWWAKPVDAALDVHETACYSSVSGCV